MKSEFLKNISDNPISFETKEDFNRYYERNKDAVDAYSTRGLNKKFIITGYRIGRKKGEIILYPVQNVVRQEEMQPRMIDEDRNMLEEKIDSINERLKKIEQMLLALVQNQSTIGTGFRQFYKN